MLHQPIHILLADDEVAIRLTLKPLLERCGYVVMTAADGIEAAALLQRHAFDLLLLDLGMPGTTLLELPQRARELQPTALILILTGSEQREAELGGPAGDGFGFIYKTASPQEVLACVTAALCDRTVT